MKRFIAGAKCPSCEQEDSLFFNSNDLDTVYCTRCNFQEKRAEKNSRDKEEIEKSNPVKWH